jgi:hypothetical protein
MSQRDFTHILGLAHQDLTNQPNYEIWKKNHEVNLNMLASVALEPPIHIDICVNSIADLLDIIDKYPATTKSNIDIKMLHKIQTELRELNSMIGIATLKTAILDQILYYLQGFHLHGSADDYKHTVLYGPPGSGKTEIAKIIGKMYSKMDIIKKPDSSVSATSAFKSSKNVDLHSSRFDTDNDLNSRTEGADSNLHKFKKITRADLVAGYLGQTAIKTKNVINESLGGVLFLDEAYSLGHKDGGDTFSKECADTLCESLSNNRENLMFIIAGYEKELDVNFFGLNPGLESRFVWRFKIDNYSYKDLWQIFLHKVKIAGWNCNDELINSGESWFKAKFDNFTGLGRDIDSLLFKTKISHSRCIYGKIVDETAKLQLTVSDLNAGFALFLKSKSSNAENEKRERKRIAESIYM